MPMGVPSMGGGGGFGQGVLNFLGGQDGATFGDVLKKMRFSAGYGSPNFVAGLQGGGQNQADEELLSLIRELRGGRKPQAVAQGSIQKIDRPPTQTMTLMNDPNATMLKTYVPAASPLSMRFPT